MFAVEEVSLYALPDLYRADFGDKTHLAKPERILEKISQIRGVSVRLVKGKLKSQRIVETRQLCMFIMRMKTDLSLKEIGLLFGGRHYSTVIHAVSVIYDRIETNDRSKDEILFFLSRQY